METPVHKSLFRLQGTTPYRTGLGLVFLLALTLIQFLFGDIFWQPNRYLLVSEGDGLKSYYVSDYHLKHDSG